MTISLVRLLQLASPTLPVGAYSYSQGLEAAVEAGIVTDAASAERWIGDVLEFSVARSDVPLLWRMLHGEDCNAEFIASRETAELRAETLQMGHSLARLASLGIDAPGRGDGVCRCLCGRGTRLEHRPARRARGLPLGLAGEPGHGRGEGGALGQTDGQKILVTLGSRLAAIDPHTEFSNFAPGLAVLSARHETQYSRLFRS